VCIPHGLGDYLMTSVLVVSEVCVVSSELCISVWIVSIDVKMTTIDVEQKCKATKT